MSPPGRIAVQNGFQVLSLGPAFARKNRASGLNPAGNIKKARQVA
jgi:hypothetical protein